MAVVGADADLQEGADLVHAVGGDRGLLRVGQEVGQVGEDPEERDVAHLALGLVGVAVPLVGQADEHEEDERDRPAAEEPPADGKQ